MFALILVFYMTAGGSHTVDPGRSFSTMAECQSAASTARGYMLATRGRKVVCGEMR